MNLFQARPKRSDIGIAGTVLLVTQVIASQQSTQTVSKQIEELRQEIQKSIVDREEYFVRKTELNSRLDGINLQLQKIQEQVDSMKHMVDEYALDDFSFDRCSLSGLLLNEGNETKL